MTSLLLKVIYIGLQGLFLPLLLMMDSAIDGGDILFGGILFLVYEVLIIGDAFLFLKIFKK